jgi:predicted metal-dependent enzyme (double-stranded beta helix superfamily)
MSHTLDSFSAECRRLLHADPGPAGREQVRQLLESVLRDDAFVASYLGPLDAPKTVLYEDPDTGFQILGHVHRSASEGAPHDHGPSWAIYGQARGETSMTEYKATGTAGGDGPTPVEVRERYVLKPGMARLYNERTVHSTRRDDETRLIRITGTDVDKVKRGRYRKVEAASA